MNFYTRRGDSEWLSNGAFCYAGQLMAAATAAQPRARSTADCLELSRIELGYNQDLTE